MFNNISVILFAIELGDLRKTIEGVLAQTFKNFELIIIDPADHSEDIEDYIVSNDKIRYINIRKKTVTEGFNSGAILSRSNFLIFLTSQDYLYPTALQNLYVHNHVDLIYGQVKIRNNIINHYGKSDLKINNLHAKNPIHLSSALIKKDLLNRIGGFDEELENNFDVDLWHRIAKTTSNIKRINSVLSETEWTNSNNEKIVPKNNYPLQNYWNIRKSVWVENYRLLNILHDKRVMWVASTSDQIDTDALITSRYRSELNNYKGRIIYHPSSTQLDEKLLNMCCAVISDFPLKTDKPNFILGSLCTHADLKIIKNLPFMPFNDYKIVFLNVCENNEDYFILLVEEICRNFKNITILIENSPEIVYRIKNLNENIKCLSIENLTVNFLREINVWAIISLAEYDNFKDFNIDFNLSLNCKAPLLISDNISLNYKNNKGVLKFSNIQTLLAKLDLLLDPKERENIISNLIFLNYKEFLMDKVLDELLLFLEEIYVPIPHSFLATSHYTDVEQLNCNGHLSIMESTRVKQSFSCTHNNLIGVEVFLNVVTNRGGEKLSLFLEDNGNILANSYLYNYQLKNGSNIFWFTNPIANAANKELIFNIHCDNQICNFEYVDHVTNVGVFWINDIPKKMCLKFRTLYR